MSPTLPAPNRRILVIDDNLSVHDAFRKLLAPSDEEPELAALGERVLGRTPDTGFEVDTAVQGEEGLQRVQQSIAEQRPYALAFVDMRMPPGWDGVETARRLWAACPELQIVICTAFADCRWNEVLPTMDAKDRLLVLKKPFDAIEVVQLATALAEKWRLHRAVSLQIADLETAVARRTEEIEHSRLAALNMMEDAINARADAEAKSRQLTRDIAERKKAEAALRASDRRFRMITETIEEVFWISDTALREVSYVSAAYERIWGRSRQSLAEHPQSFFEAVLAGDEARVRAELDQRGRDQPFGHSFRIVRPSGAVRCIWNRGFPVRGADGRVTHYVGVAQDVTDRERADRELQETRDNYRLIFENAIEGIYQASPDGRLLAANPALARMFGFESAGAMIAATPDVARWWVDPAARAEFVRRAESEGAVAGFEWEGRRPDGSRFWVVENGRCVRGKSGRVLRYDGTLEDITDARRAALQQRLEQEIATILARSASSSEAYPLVLQALGTALEWDCGQLWLVDRTGNGLRCTAAWSSGGIDPRQFAAASELATEAPGCGRLDRVCATGACEQGDGATTASDALMRKFGLQAFMVFPLVLEERRLGVVALYRQRPREGVDFPCALLEVLGTHFAEFIQRQHITEQLRQAQKLEALGNLAGGIAHDFNNVLAAITGYSELAQMDSKGNPTVHSHLEGVLTGARRATALVKQILAFCRQQEQSRRPIQVRHTIAEALRLLRAAAPANIEFATDIRRDAPVVLADATQLHQVVMNLATNAVHAMRERGGRLTVTIEDFAADEQTAAISPDLRPGRYARLTVSDTGHGMDAATRERIFDPFFTTKPVGEGTGLGLSVVHGIVRAHDGAITVASRPGEGATFQIYLPAHLAEAEQQVARTAELPRGHGERVLVVDDEPAIADISTRVLRALGYAVEGTTDPRAALELVAKDPAAFALVLTDQGMPGMSGVELAQHIHEIRADLPVVLTSGYTATLQREELSRRGITELLAKPLTVDDLATVVHRALAGHGETPP